MRSGAFIAARIFAHAALSRHLAPTARRKARAMRVVDRGTGCG